MKDLQYDIIYRIYTRIQVNITPGFFRKIMGVKNRLILYTVHMYLALKYVK